MILPAYLKARNETQLHFAIRADMAVSTVSKICQGGGATATNVVKIRRATKGRVRDVDLVPRGRFAKAGS